jgi:hypothetical protein
MVLLITEHIGALELPPLHILEIEAPYHGHCVLSKMETGQRFPMSSLEFAVPQVSPVLARSNVAAIEKSGGLTMLEPRSHKTLCQEMKTAGEQGFRSSDADREMLRGH